MTQNPDHLKERLSRPGRTTWSLAGDLRILAEQHDAVGKNLGMFAEYIPVKIVNIFECLFRASVKELIDSNIFYSRNSVRYLEKVKGKDIVDVMHYAEDRKATIGDIVASTVTHNTINDITNCLGILIAKDFKDEIAKTSELWVDDDAMRSPIILDIDRTYSILADIYKMRHIVVHENPAKPIFDVKDVPNMFIHSLMFSNALCWFVSNDIVGPRTSNVVEQSIARP